jgi:chloride channel protein, CIC family
MAIMAASSCLLFWALIVGAVSGLVGAPFLLLLERANTFRDSVIVWAHSEAFAGFLMVSIACAAGAGGAWLDD